MMQGISFLKVVKEKKCWHKPWLTKGLLRSIKNKNILYKRFIRSATVQNNTLYKNYKNKLNHLIRIAKRMYYEQQLSNSKSNIKLTWKILNRIINENNSKSKISDIFTCDDVKITDPLQIANKFCHYFTNIGLNLANKIPDTSKSPLKYMNDNFPNSMVLNLVSDNEVTNIVNSFKSGSAAGYDNISMNIIKQSIHLIVELITHIINLSITNGVVPDKMKLARIIPVFKCNDQTQLSNYRPISVLLAFSKILERVIYNRMVHYLDNYNILCHQQFGFRKGYSTSMALIRLSD